MRSSLPPTGRSAAILLVALSLIVCSSACNQPDSGSSALQATKASAVPEPPPPPPKIPILTDTAGKSWEVDNLEAKFSAGGMWMGTRPTSTQEGLPIVLSVEEDRVTTHETIDIPFTSIRRIVFSGAEIPQALKGPFKDSDPMRIDRRDGTVLLLSESRFAELDAGGSVRRSIEIESYIIKTGDAQGESISLDGFGGKSKTKAGQVGDFEIARSETKSIDFQ